MLTKKDVKEWITSTPEQTTSTTRIHSSGKWKRPPTVWVICNYDASHHQGINDSGVAAWVWSFVIVMVRSWSVEWENFREEKLQHKQNWQLLYGLCKHVRARGYTNVVFEVDNETINNILSSAYSQFNHYIYTILCWQGLKRFTGFSAKK